jgi:hypothetical protein
MLILHRFIRVRAIQTDDIDVVLTTDQRTEPGSQSALHSL